MQWRELGNLRKTVEDDDVGFDILSLCVCVCVFFLGGGAGGMYLLWCLFLFSLKFNCLQRVFLNEKSRPTIIVEILTTFCRRGNGAIDVSDESTSALFHISKCGAFLCL